MPLSPCVASPSLEGHFLLTFAASLEKMMTHVLQALLSSCFPALRGVYGPINVFMLAPRLAAVAFSHEPVLASNQD